MYSRGKLYTTKYVSEEVDWFDFVELDRLSMVELNKMAIKLRLTGKMAYTWLYPNTTIVDGGLRCLDSDEDITTMIKELKEKKLRIVKMYVIHLTDKEAKLKLELMRADLLKQHAAPKRLPIIEEINDDEVLPQKQILAIEWVSNDGTIAENEIQIEEVPNMIHGEEQMEEVPNTNHGEEQMEEVPNTNQGEEQREEVPNMIHGEEQREEVPNMIHGEEQMENVPNTNHGEEQREEVPNTNHGEEQREEVPNTNHGEEQREEVPNTNHGEKQREEVPNMIHGEEVPNMIHGEEVPNRYNDRREPNQSDNVDVREWVDDSEEEYNGGISRVTDTGGSSRVTRAHPGKGTGNNGTRSSTRSSGHVEDEEDMTTFTYVSESELLAEVGWGSEEDTDDDEVRFPEFDIDRDLANPVLEENSTVQIATAHTKHSCGVDEDLRALSKDFLAHTQWIRSDGPKIRPPTFAPSTSGPKQKKRRLEAGEHIQRKKDKRGRDVMSMSRAGMVMKCSLCKGEGHNKRKCNNMTKTSDVKGTQDPGVTHLNTTLGEEGHHSMQTDLNSHTTAEGESMSIDIDLNTNVWPEGESSSPRAGTSSSGFTFMPNPSHVRSKLGVQRGRGGRRT
ncbi:hypothetical protein LINPERHAP1_LOCUS26755 [Linum perenne]